MGDQDGFSYKEKAFILFYIREQNASKAIIATGYKGPKPEAAGYKMLNKPGIKRYIEQQLSIKQQEAVQKLEVSFEWIANKLKTIACKCVPDGVEIIEAKQAVAAVGALSELNKMMGNYSPERHVNVNVNADADLERVRELAKKYQRDF